MAVFCTEGQFQNLYALLFYTGMRGGEALALTFEHIDFKQKKIYIRQTIRKGIIGVPKTQNSVRDITIPDILMPYLEKQYELTADKNSFVFLNSNDQTFWDISKVRDGNWKRLLKKLGIKYRNIHQTRHTYCSTMISKGIDILYVSKNVGHKSAKITLETYSKYIPVDTPDLADIFGKNTAPNDTILAPKNSVSLESA